MGRRIPAIHCSELKRHFKRGEHAVHAVDGVSFDVSIGEFFGIVGTSGSGKTTLLNLIGGLDTPSSGHLEVLGKRLDSLDSRGLALYRRNTVGIVFQAFHLLPAQSAYGNVELPLLLAGVPPDQRESRVARALEELHLSDRSHHKPEQLSGGQRQRVAIARATVTHPRVLLADEPTGNLDHKSGQDVIGILEELNSRGITLIMVTHDPEMGRRARRQLHMMDGRLTHDRGSA